MPNYDVDEHRVETIARVCHEANREYCQIMGDFTQVPWMDAPDWQKNSARNGVKHIIENPDATPEDSHNMWKAQKEKEGWYYGAVKDIKMKTHPCMVDYDDLPVDQRVKDYIFLGVVKSFLTAEEDARPEEKKFTKEKAVFVTTVGLKKELEENGFFEDCDIVVFGASTMGKSWDKIFVAQTPGNNVAEEKYVKYVETRIKTRLKPGGKLILL